MDHMQSYPTASQAGGAEGSSADGGGGQSALYQSPAPPPSQPPPAHLQQQPYHYPHYDSYPQHQHHQQFRGGFQPSQAPRQHEQHEQHGQPRQYLPQQPSQHHQPQQRPPQQHEPQERQPLPLHRQYEPQQHEQRPLHHEQQPHQQHSPYNQFPPHHEQKQEQPSFSSHNQQPPRHHLEPYPPSSAAYSASYADSRPGPAQPVSAQPVSAHATPAHPVPAHATPAQPVHPHTTAPVSFHGAPATSPSGFGSGLGLGSITSSIPTPGTGASASPASESFSPTAVRPGSGSVGSPLAVTASQADDGDGALDTDPDEGPSKKRQRRNKPTLSCRECVDRKTKCDRGRPHCIACLKRQTECIYAPIADLIQETSRSANSGRRITVPPKRKLTQHPQQSQQSQHHVDPKPVPPSQNDTSNMLPVAAAVANPIISPTHIHSHTFASLQTGLLSNIPYTMPGAGSVLGIGSRHPFGNYWTRGGGIDEVISVLPEEAQAKAIIDRYFECVDPVYPMIHRQTFYADYAGFWAINRINIGILSRQRNDGVSIGGGDGQDIIEAEPDFVALMLIMMSLGMQFMPSTPSLSPEAKKQGSEFFASGSNQALRCFSYMSQASIRSVQAMVLVTYFLINDNHCSDGWAFAGMLIRQAYAMGLHREPNIITPNATIFEKHQRRKLWQAVLLQDTFLTVLLSLPPSATHTDVSVDALTDDAGSIAMTDPNDMAYVRGSWTLANLVQEAICSPRSLEMPVCMTPRHKSKLVAEFRAVYRSFPDVFRSWDAESLAALAEKDPRVVRQTLFLTSNYFHNLMLVYASGTTPASARGKGQGQGQGQAKGQAQAGSSGGSSAGGSSAGSSAESDVTVNIRGTLDAAHDAITSFFVLYDIFPADAAVWWVFNHRAFIEALFIGDVLRAWGQSQDSDVLKREPPCIRGKDDIERMIEIMRCMGEGVHGSSVARLRVEMLEKYL